MNAEPRRVLTIAGSDPSGGAGVQADLRVFAALGAAGLSAITALTVQNSHGVRTVYPVPGDVLRQQIEAVLEDCDVHAVKIIGDDAALNVVANTWVVFLDLPEPSLQFSASAEFSTAHDSVVDIDQALKRCHQKGAGANGRIQHRDGR